ncbi:MarR family winged helix-turn-helix transcriptional regulator [Serinibacter salmoneus]|uniref:MarR family winged helix-turn-helix transcriptional regulator n=1 Tax=Serinibacter salmoneus TaxID=556530 RepID=UPI001FEC1331|nr:MarR family winged helix-turn-helix transcriptional regulator [Serinibacter salmoneus]
MAAALDDLVCFAMYGASHATTQAYRALLRPWGLTYPQYLVLVVLWRVGECPVRRLEEETGLDSGTLSPLLRRLRDRGLIARRPNPEDARSVLIALTPEAEEIREHMTGVGEEVGRHMGIGEVEARELISRLRLLTEAMTAVAEAPRPATSAPHTSAAPAAEN